MNAERRKRISALEDKLNENLNELDEILSEEQDYYDNMPESLQGGRKRRKRTRGDF